MDISMTIPTYGRQVWMLVQEQIIAVKERRKARPLRVPAAISSALGIFLLLLRFPPVSSQSTTIDMAQLSAGQSLVVWARDDRKSERIVRLPLLSSEPLIALLSVVSLLLSVPFLLLCSV
jgi:hypothetical protein